mgnify:CR=1 FL=1
MNKKQLVEIARSFSYKHNLGNYQSADFFCSQKAEVLVEEAEKVSEKLYQFCKKEVIKSLNDYLQLQVDMTGGKTESPGKTLGGWVDLGGGKGIFPEKDVYRATDYKGGKEKIIKQDLTPY